MKMRKSNEANFDTNISGFRFGGVFFSHCNARGIAMCPKLLPVQGQFDALTFLI